MYRYFPKWEKPDSPRSPLDLLERDRTQTFAARGGEPEPEVGRASPPIGPLQVSAPSHFQQLWGNGTVFEYPSGQGGEELCVKRFKRTWPTQKPDWMHTYPLLVLGLTFEHEHLTTKCGHPALRKPMQVKGPSLSCRLSSTRVHRFPAKSPSLQRAASAPARNANHPACWAFLSRPRPCHGSALKGKLCT